MTPEQKARIQIDTLLEQAGWALQDVHSLNLSAARGVAVREFGLKPGYGTADYLLYVDGEAVGVVEAKPAGLHPYRCGDPIRQVQRRSAGHAARAP